MTNITRGNRNITGCFFWRDIPFEEDMPFDRGGVHATGREVWQPCAAGIWQWQAEFEDDPTWDCPQ